MVLMRSDSEKRRTLSSVAAMKSTSELRQGGRSSLVFVVIMTFNSAAASRRSTMKVTALKHDMSSLNTGKSALAIFD